MNSSIPIDVLIVDDSRADAQLAQLWLLKSPFIRSAQIARTGQEALARMRRQTPFENEATPKLVLLDVNLPDMVGWEFLEALRQDENLAGTPVMVVTGTVRATEIEKSQSLDAVRCLTKPFDADEFQSLVREVETVLSERYSS